jgi:NitT/TauT family transport system substrate-binding protein
MKMASHTTNRRQFLTNAALFGGLISTPILIGIRAGLASDEAEVRMQLGWLVSNGVLGEVVATKKGFFKEQGVALNIVPGGPNVDGVAGVAAGQSTIGQLSSSLCMLARSAGIPLKAFLARYRKHPFT